MKTDSLVLIIGILGVLIGGYFLIMGKDPSTSLIGFICGACLLFLWGYLKKSRARIK